MAHAQSVVHWNDERGAVAWRPATLRQLGRSEEFLENALATTPELLGITSRRTGVHGPFQVFRQAALSTPSGRNVYPDIVMLSASGHAVVVEVKLADNPELRDRAVIAQVLDYASSFAALSDATLLNLFRDGSAAETWTDRIGELFPEDDRPEELADVIRDRIRNGEVNLVIACDRIPPGLPEVVRGVATQKAFGFELDLVEVVPYTAADNASILFVPSTRLATEIVARTAVTVIYEQGDPKPEIRVQTTSLDEIERNVESARTTGSTGRVWTQSEVEEAFERDGVLIEKELLRFAKAHSAGGELVSAATKQTATFGFYITGVRAETGKPAKNMLFYCVLGWTAITFSLSSTESLLGTAGYAELQRRLGDLIGDALKPGARQPTIPLSVLASRLSEFEDLVLWVQNSAATRAGTPSA